MGSNFFILFVVVPVALLIFFAFLNNPGAEKRRQKDLARLAQKLGLGFNPADDSGLAQRFLFLSDLKDAEVPYASNTIRGKSGGYPVIAFDFHCTVYMNSNVGVSPLQCVISILVLELKGNFPELTVVGDKCRSKLKKQSPHPDIDLESAEFSQAFQVRSANKKFAYDFCNARMMEYLLTQRNICLEVERGTLALAFDRRLAAPEIETGLQRLKEIRLRMPDYLFTKV